MQCSWCGKWRYNFYCRSQLMTKYTPYPYLSTSKVSNIRVLTGREFCFLEELKTTLTNNTNFSVKQRALRSNSTLADKTATQHQKESTPKTFQNWSCACFGFVLLLYSVSSITWRIQQYSGVYLAFSDKKDNHKRYDCISQLPDLLLTVESEMV